MKYRNFDPPIKISSDELEQIDAYRRSILALQTLGFDDPDTLATDELLRTTLKEELALLAYYSAPLLGRMWAKQLDAVLKQEAEERTVLRNEKLDAWFKGLPSPPV